MKAQFFALLTARTLVGMALTVGGIVVLTTG